MNPRCLDLSILLTTLASTLACSSPDSGYNTLDPTGGSADTGSGSGSGSGSGTTGVADSGGGPTGGASTGGLEPTTGGTVGAGTTTGGELGADDVCAAVALETEAIQTEIPREITTTTEIEILAPVAIYIVLDNSGSMDEGGPGQGGDTKWNQAETALTDFVNDPNSAGVDVAIQYFHPPGQGQGRGQQAGVNECDGVAHTTPAVPMGPLPDNAGAMVSSLGGTGPNGDTPTVGALSGGIAYCTSFQAAHPDEECIVVLVTDGQPNGCGLTSDCPGTNGGNGNNDCVDPLSESMLTPIASAGSTAGVTTFTVGMQGVTPDGFTLLNALAVAGGSDCTPDLAGAEACDVSATGGAGLLDALNTIRDTVVVTETTTETTTETIVETVAVPCQWALPLPPAGQTLDPNLVNVVVSVNAVSTKLGKVQTPADCANTVDGWYYDLNDAPTTILICPQTCAAVEASVDVHVQVELGCATDIAVPK